MCVWVREKERERERERKVKNTMAQVKMGKRKQNLSCVFSFERQNIKKEGEEE